MTLTSHSLIAAAIVTKVTNPLIGLPLVLVSHFIADKVPHWDIMTNKTKKHPQIITETIIDFLCGFGLAAFFFVLATPATNPVYFFTAILISQSPDLLEAPYVLPKIKNPISTYVYRFQHHIHDLWFDARLTAPWGIVTQVGVVSIFLFWAVS